MATDSILFYTAGVTDLQALIRLADGSLVRGVIDDGAVRAFHQALLDGSLRYQIVDDPALRKHLKEFKFSIMVDPTQTGGLKLEAKADCGEARFDWAEGETGVVRLFPAKLAVLHHRLKTDGLYRLRGAVGFFTYRDGSFAKEPIALGKILSAWLAACLASGDSKEVNYLDGKMKTPDEGRDTPFNRLAAQRIEDAIREAHASQPNATALAMLVGGLPGAKEVILAALELHFPKVLQWLQAVDEPPQEVTTPAPQDALRVRRIARGFVQHGRFVEAAAVACEYVDDVYDREWALPLRLTAMLFIDNPLRTYCEHPPQGLPKDLARLARHWPLRALLPALRAEAALAAGRYLEAINWSLTFFDAALLDSIEQTQGPINDWEKTIDFQGNPQDADRLLKEKCIEQKLSTPSYEYSTMGRKNRIWLSVIKRPKLSALNRALQTEDAQRKRLADYRNLNTHSVMTEAQLREAIARFTSHQIWHIGNAIPHGQRFIGNSLAQPIFEELGFPNAADCYADLVFEMLKNLDAHAIR